MKKQIKEWREIHKKQRNESIKERRKNDKNFKILMSLRARIPNALKGNPKIATTMKLVGCSIEFLKQHLQNQFKKGMAWNNYGRYGWHIDHKIPCCSFDLSKMSEQRKCFNYKNLQPLWAKENCSKNRK